MSWKAFEELVRSHFEDELGLRLESQVVAPLPDGSRHNFDLVSPDNQIAIECKSHTWTKSGNSPSAKVSDAKMTVEILRKSSNKRRMLVFQDDFFDEKSLAETFVRRNTAALKGIEVWAYSNGEFRRLETPNT